MRWPLATEVGLFALCVLLGACVSAPVLYERKLVDLTHSFGDTTATYPGDPPFVYERDAERRADGSWSATGSIRGPEAAGTHLIAPMRFAEGRLGTDQIPLTRFVGPIRVVDVRARMRDRGPLTVGLEDLEQHERRHGRIPRGAAVLVRTGWDQYWRTPERYFGSLEAPRHPGLSAELARTLVDKGVDVVGIDGPSIDPVDASGARATRILGESDVPALANLTGLDQLPPLGATLIALPLKIERGAGGPTRVVAIVP